MLVLEDKYPAMSKEGVGVAMDKLISLYTVFMVAEVVERLFMRVTLCCKLMLFLSLILNGPVQ